MSRLPIRDESTLSEACLAVLEPTRINGKIADVYLQFANSEASTIAYMAMEKSLQSASLSALEIESIKLFVSELTQCDFCLSMHTMKSRKVGIDKPMQIAIRRGEPTSNARVDALLAMVAAFFKQPGALSDQLINDAREAGLSDQELVETTMAVSTIFFTNIANHINKTETSLPPAPSIEQA